MTHRSVRKRARALGRSLVPPLVLSLLRRAPREAASSFLGLDGLDRRLAAHLDLDRPGYFVELGANDGLRQSNTHFLEVEHGWSGLLIEPALVNYVRLLRNRSDRNAFACVACVPFGYPSDFVRMRYADLMSVATTLDTDLSDPEDHVHSAVRFLADGREVVEFGAVARPLSHVLDDCGAPPVIDLLSLDVEGAELDVLRGVDHSKYRFRRILVECRDVERLGTYLSGEGYELVERLSHHDYIFGGTDVPTDDGQARSGSGPLLPP